jgi:hypothetical protein
MGTLVDPLTQGSRWFRRHRLAAWVILTVLFIVSLIGLITFYLPDQVRSWQFWTQKPEDVRNLSLVVLGCISVLAGSIGVVFSYFRTSAANLQAQIAEQGHITDRFTKAVEQLGNDKLEVRLGAIYALERIARDSRRDHGPIMETLIAYVRENAPWPPKGDAEGLEELLAVAVSADGGSRGGPTDEEKPVRADEEPARAKPRTDVQAALTVLGRREWRHDVEGVSLNLAETDLRGANLHSAVLEGGRPRLRPPRAGLPLRR